MSFKRILVPIDGSEATERAIEASVSLARQLGASIVGFLAEPATPTRDGEPPRGALEPDELDPEAMTAERARPVLSHFEAVARAARVPFEGVCDRVPPRLDKAIIAAAESHGCDMIVMVSHGRGAFGEFLFGSQSKAVLAGTKLPLLVVH
jgi:nucleotide-binding universal stress UspA family protein